MVSTEAIKELREMTGAGIMGCKKALEEAKGDIDDALEILRRQGHAKAEKKAHREVSQGLIEAYIHTGGRIGAMVEVNCESDFVAHTDEFRGLAHDLAMQVAATAPSFLSGEDAPQEPLVRPDETAEARTQREDHVEVRNRQELPAARLKPVLRDIVTALRTVAVAARVVGVVLVAAAVATPHFSLQIDIQIFCDPYLNSHSIPLL